MVHNIHVSQIMDFNLERFMEKELKIWEPLVTFNDKYDRFTLKLKSHKYLESTYILLSGSQYYILTWNLSKSKIILLVIWTMLKKKIKREIFWKWSR